MTDCLFVVLRRHAVSFPAAFFRSESMPQASKTLKTIIPTVSTVFKKHKTRKICVPARTRRRSRKNCSISFPTTHQIYKAFCGALTSTACAIDGMLSPCKDEVCDISAPVATKTTRFNSPAVTRRRI